MNNGVTEGVRSEARSVLSRAALSLISCVPVPLDYDWWSVERRPVQGFFDWSASFLCFGLEFIILTLDGVDYCLLSSIIDGVAVRARVDE